MLRKFDALAFAYRLLINTMALSGVIFLCQ